MKEYKRYGIEVGQVYEDLYKVVVLDVETFSDIKKVVVANPVTGNAKLMSCEYLIKHSRLVEDNE